METYQYERILNEQQITNRLLARLIQILEEESNEEENDGLEVEEDKRKIESE